MGGGIHLGEGGITRAIQERDYPLTQSTILFIAVMFMTINLAIDLLYSYLDPRIRYGQ